MIKICENASKIDTLIEKSNKLQVRLYRKEEELEEKDKFEYKKAIKKIDKLAESTVNLSNSLSETRKKLKSTMSELESYMDKVTQDLL